MCKCHASHNPAVAAHCAVLVLALAGLLSPARSIAGPPQPSIEFSIDSGPLHRALNVLAEQSGLQTAYDPELLADKQAPAVSGRMPVDAALNQLLRASGLDWMLANECIITVRARRQSLPLVPLQSTSRAPRVQEEVVSLSDLSVSEDASSAVPSVGSSMLGFDKSILETPRAVSFISEQTIDRFALGAVENLLRVVPGVYTTTRFGIQGAVDIRAVPADTYFRGMKRLSLQGHGRSVLAAMDGIEVVRGPPSPLYGMGKIGGYTNFQPKSGRARSGAYLSDTQGFTQVIYGDDRRREVSFGVGGPLAGLDRLEGKRGGYYIYGLVEDSDSYTAGVPVRQQLLQAAMTVDDLVGPLRLETGANYQVSRTAGALTGRFTQDLVDSGRYIRGTPLVNLDANGNGSIGYLEQHRGSPVRGQISSGNQPLIQTWDWPRDAAGKPLPLDQRLIAAADLAADR